MHNPAELVTTPREAARILNVVPDVVISAIRSGKLPATRVGKRWIISKYDLVDRAHALGKEIDLDLPR